MRDLFYVSAEMNPEESVRDDISHLVLEMEHSEKRLQFASQALSNTFCELFREDMSHLRYIYFLSDANITRLAPVVVRTLKRKGLATRIETSDWRLLGELESISDTHLFSLAPDDERRSYKAFQEIKVTDKDGTSPIHGLARFRVNQVRDEFMSSHPNTGLIMAGAIGLNWLDTPYDGGPYCHSHHESLFRRALFESGAPIVLFSDEESSNDPIFIPPNKFFVCDREFSWQYVCQRMPVALVCAFKNEQIASQAVKNIGRGGFTQIRSIRGLHGYLCVLAINDRFRKFRTMLRVKRLLEGAT